MLDRDFFAKSDEAFRDLLTLTNEELGSKGLNMEPSVIVNRIISPLRDIYLRNLAELLESSLENNPR